MKVALNAEQTSFSPLITVGPGMLELATLCQLLSGAGVERLVDLRRFPASRRLSHLSSAALRPALEEAGLAYRWEERLGGRRRLPKPDPEDDSWWKRSWANELLSLRASKGRRTCRNSS